ncbi:MAG TPA: hypothetical protein VIU64_10125 [Polyangia bacterium]
MAGRKRNSSADGEGVKMRDGVWVSREEFDALMSLKEANADSVVRDAEAANRNHDLLATCNAQARRLVEVDLAIVNYERITALQRAYIDLLRDDHPRVGSMEDLSEFWRQWTLCTNNLVQSQPQQRAVVAEMTPDLFRSWALWVRDSGRLNRSFSVAGTRAEIEAKQPATADDVQDGVIARLRDSNAMLAARVKELEGEVEAYRRAKDKRP